MPDRKFVHAFMAIVASGGFQMVFGESCDCFDLRSCLREKLVDFENKFEDCRISCAEENPEILAIHECDNQLKTKAFDACVWGTIGMCRNKLDEEVPGPRKRRSVTDRVFFAHGNKLSDTKLQDSQSGDVLEGQLALRKTSDMLHCMHRCVNSPHYRNVMNRMAVEKRDAISNCSLIQNCDVNEPKLNLLESAHLRCEEQYGVRLPRCQCFMKTLNDTHGAAWCDGEAVMQIHGYRATTLEKTWARQLLQHINQLETIDEFHMFL